MNNEIIKDWLKEGIELGSPASVQEIQDCEQIIGFTFPDDFKEFYSIHNGFKEWIMDLKLLSLWSLQLILSNYVQLVTSSYEKQDFVGFCDYLADSSRIGFLKGKFGIYKDYDRILICDSFDEFIKHWKQESHNYF